MIKDKEKLLSIIIILVIAAGILSSTFFGYAQAAENAEERARMVLTDSAREQANTFNAIINGQYQVLETVAYALSNMGSMDDEQMRQLISNISKNVDFSYMRFIYPDGRLLDANYINVSNRQYFQDSMNGKYGCQYITAAFSNEKALALSIPYYNDGQIVGVLNGIYYENDLRELLVSQAYGSAGYSLLVDSSGTVVIGTENNRNLYSGSKLATIMSSASDSSIDYSQLITSMSNGESGIFTATINNANRIIAYLPLTSSTFLPDSWYIFNVVSSDVLSAEVNTEQRSAVTQSLIIIFCGGVAVVMLALIERHRRKMLSRQSEAHRLREEQLEIVAKQGTRNIFSYDIVTKTYTKLFMQDDLLIKDDVIVDPVEVSFKSNAIDSTSVEDYRRFFERIEAGENNASADIHLSAAFGGRWYRYSATVQYSDSGAPTMAIVSYYDCTESRMRELAYTKWQQYISTIDDREATVHEWNLTTDVCETTRNNDSTRDLDWFDPVDFDKTAKCYCSAAVHEDDRTAYSLMMNRVRLIGAYHSGTDNMQLDYRELQPDGSYRWHQVAVRMVSILDNETIKASVIRRDIDEEKQEQLASVSHSHLDPVTDVLNHRAFFARAAEVLKSQPHAIHVFMALDIDGLNAATKTLGRDYAAATLRELAVLIRSTLRTCDVIGRAENGRFMLLLPDMPFNAAIQRKADQICDSYVHSSHSSSSISISAGIAIYPQNSESVGALYKMANAALNRITGTGSYTFYDKSIDDAQNDNAYSLSNKIAKNGASVNVLFACGDDYESASLARQLDEEFTVLAVHNIQDTNAIYERHFNEISAVLVDIDTTFGVNVMRSHSSGEYGWRVPLIAITGMEISNDLVDIVENCAAFVAYKPIDVDRFLLSLHLQITRARKIRQYIQSGYSKLQSADEERYREILNATETVVLVYDPSTRAYTLDPLAKKYVAGNFDGRYLSDVLLDDGVVDKDTVEQGMRLLHSVAAGEQRRNEMTAYLKSASGKQRWFHIQFIRLDSKDELTRKLLITLNDENDKILAEQRLRDTSGQLRAILDNMYGGMSVVTLSAERPRYIFANEQYFTMFGYTREQFMSELESSYDAIHPDDRAWVAKSASESLEKNKNISLDYRCIKRDGSVIWVRCKASNTRFEGIDEPVQLAVSYDVTNEYDMMKMRAENIKLSSAVEQAQFVSRSKSEFLARISHDIRTPMNAIIGFSEDDLLHNASQEQRDDYFKKINDSGKYMLTLINDVLDISKIESGKLALHEQPECLASLVDGVSTIIQTLADKKGVFFNVSQRNITIEWAMGDRMHLQQILINLLNNAVKFTPPGGTVTLDIEETHIENGRVYDTITISDTGIGMKEEFLKRMYDPFEQEETASSQQGTGLGLSIVKNLVELCGGTISASSMLGVGTVFTVKLSFEICDKPSSDGSRSASPGSPDGVEPDAEAFAGKRALICEDNAMNTEIAARLLERVGIEADTAENGMEGVNKFLASAPYYYDIVLMDVRMPQMNGMEATRAIRASDRLDAKTVPILAMTANAFGDDVSACIDAGMNEHLAKPIVPNKLYKAITEYLS